MFKVRVNQLLLLPFLVIFYFVLHECNANFGLIPAGVLIKHTIYYVLTAAGVLALSYVILKKTAKAVLFTFLIVCLLLFFGSFHDLVKQLPVGRFVKRYVFIYPFLTVTMVAAFMVIRRRNSNFQRLVKYLQITALILLAWEGAFFFVNLFNGKASRNILFADTTHEPALQARAFPNEQKPDIYFIVFDAYTSTRCLREEFDYDNSALDSFLRAKKFYIVTHGKSNYPVTPYSIASTLNFSYLTPAVTRHTFTAQDIVKGMKSIEHVRLVPYVEQQGYAVFNHSIFNLPGHPVKENEFFGYLKEGLLTRQTFVERFRADIGWNFSMRNWRTGAVTTAEVFPKERTKWLRTFLYNELDGLQKALSKQQEQPKFVYCHVLMPHEPYYFNSDGSFVSDAVFYFSKQPKTSYRNQLIHTNTILRDVVNSIFTCDHKNKIVIVEGDHGFRDYGQKDKAKRIFENLNAIYFYDGNYSALYNTMSPVNTFRVVLNQYFHENLPYLKDSSIFIKDPGIDLGDYKP